MKPFTLCRNLSALLLLWVLAAGCNRDAAPPGKEPARRQALTICQGGILAALPIIAQEKGFFAAQGLDVTFTIVGDGKATMEAFLAGKCDLGIMGDPPIVKQSFNRDDIAIVASVVSSANTSRILARRDRGITTPASLSGKRIGVSKATNSHFFLDQYLLQHGIPKGRVTLLDISNKELADALLRGDIDAFAGSDLSFLKGEQALGKNGIVLAEPGLTNFSANLVVKKDWLAANGSTVRKLLQALMQAEQELVSHPVDARRLVAARLKVPELQLAAIMAQQRSAVAMDQILVLSLEDQAQWMLESGMVKGATTPNFLRVLDPTLLRELRPSAVTLK